MFTYNQTEGGDVQWEQQRAQDAKEELANIRQSRTSFFDW